MLSPPRFLTLPLALALALALACSADPVDTGRRDAGGADGGDALDAGSPDAIMNVPFMPNSLPHEFLAV